MFYSVVAWLPTVLADRGLSPTDAGVHLLVLQLAGLASGLALPPVLRGRRDQRGVAALAAACVVLGYAGLAALPGGATGWVAAAAGGWTVALLLLAAPGAAAAVAGSPAR